jgi:hypothetical protein
VRGFRHRSLERRLRRERPQPRTELLASIARELGGARRPTARLRLGFAGALTGALVVMLASVGGIGYAASAAKQAVHAVQRVVTPQHAIAVEGLSAGGDQYKPGYGWGDKNHNHTGPPGLKRTGGAMQPLLKAKNAPGKNQAVSFKLNLDEQAHLWISVLDSKGKALLLNQNGSRVAQGIKGKQTKHIQYVALIPRSIPVSLRIPSNLLKPGATYRIRIVAKDPQGNKRILIIPFRG